MFLEAKQIGDPYKRRKSLIKIVSNLLIKFEGKQRLFLTAHLRNIRVLETGGKYQDFLRKSFFK
jgi:hypothetical protein